MTERRYSKDEVDAILGRAIEREHRRGELTHEDLVAAASEVGIPTEAIETAASEVLAERVERTELVTMRREQWRGFLGHLVPYLFVNGLLVTLNVLTTHFPWAIFPAFGWGIGLVSHFLAVLWPNRRRLERRLERKRDQERRQAIKQQVRTNVRQIEKDVGQGISAVLQAAADRIAGYAPSTDRTPANRARVPDTSDQRSSSANEERPADNSKSANPGQPPTHQRHR